MTSARFAAACFAAAALAAIPAHALPPAAEEPHIKAQFFERFTRFIDWPPQALANGPFVVCLVGSNDLAAEIERRMARTTVKAHATAVRRLRPTPTPDTAGCHALYLAPAPRAQLDALLARTRGRPILTVGDSDGLCHLGALINMFIEDRYVRFEINPGAMRASGLVASSKLLRLARLVAATP